MSDFKVGSTVKLKGGNQLMTVTQLREYNCEVTWTIEGGEINSYTYQLSALEIVSEKEVAQERKRYNRRENAKVGLSVANQINKIVSPLVALVSVIAISIQTNRLKDLENKIDMLIQKQTNEISEIKKVEIESHKTEVKGK